MSLTNKCAIVYIILTAASVEAINNFKLRCPEAISFQLQVLGQTSCAGYLVVLFFLVLHAV